MQRLLRAVVRASTLTARRTLATAAAAAARRVTLRGARARTLSTATAGRDTSAATTAAAKNTASDLLLTPDANAAASSAPRPVRRRSTSSSSASAAPASAAAAAASGNWLRVTLAGTYRTAQLALLDAATPAVRARLTPGRRVYLHRVPAAHTSVAIGVFADDASFRAPANTAPIAWLDARDAAALSALWDSGDAVIDATVAGSAAAGPLDSATAAPAPAAVPAADPAAATAAAAAASAAAAAASTVTLSVRVLAAPRAIPGVLARLRPAADAPLATALEPTPFSTRPVQRFLKHVATYTALAVPTTTAAAVAVVAGGPNQRLTLRRLPTHATGGVACIGVFAATAPASSEATPLALLDPADSGVLSLLWDVGLARITAAVAPAAPPAAPDAPAPTAAAAAHKPVPLSLRVFAVPHAQQDVVLLLTGATPDARTAPAAPALDRTRLELPYEPSARAGIRKGSAAAALAEGRPRTVDVAGEADRATHPHGRAPSCFCGLESRLELVKRADTPNRGRTYWCCGIAPPKKRACNYFKWTDGKPSNTVAAAGGAAGASPAVAPNASPVSLPAHVTSPITE